MEKLSEEEIRERLEKYPKIREFFGSKILAEVRNHIIKKSILTFNIEIANDVFLKRVENCLENLEDVKGFKKRIDNYKKNFQEIMSLIPELMEALYMKNKGYEIEFIPETKKNGTPDFKAKYNNKWIDFEIKAFSSDQKKYETYGTKTIFEIKEGKFFPKGLLVKIRNKIKDAYRQLESKKQNPKIIALYSYDIMIQPELINFELHIPPSDSSLVNGIVFYSLGTKMRFFWENKAVSKEMHIPNLQHFLSDP
jgi:hypothetical protein